MRPLHVPAFTLSQFTAFLGGNCHLVLSAVPLRSGAVLDVARGAPSPVLVVSLLLAAAIALTAGGPVARRGLAGVTAIGSASLLLASLPAWASIPALGLVTVGVMRLAPAGERSLAALSAARPMRRVGAALGGRADSRA
jgi:hypothetical protein